IPVKKRRVRRNLRKNRKVIKNFAAGDASDDSPNRKTKDSFIIQSDFSGPVFCQAVGGKNTNGNHQPIPVYSERSYGKQFVMHVQSPHSKKTLYKTAPGTSEALLFPFEAP